MKKISLLLLVLLLVGCNEVAPERNVEREEVEEVQEEVVQEIGGRETAKAESDSTLKASGDGRFSYEAENIFDRDIATAWCKAPYDPEAGPFTGTLDVFFEDAIGGKWFGIVPGFAAEEEIYWQNNRIKKLVVGDGVSPMLEDATIFELKDQYGMQFFRLPEDVGTHLNLAVLEVYPGSKYDDTCIAELDLWSDWVETQDWQAAMEFYLAKSE